MQQQGLRSSDDGWPWPSLLMLGLHVLHLSEEEFWKMTPRKFTALIEAYAEFKNGKPAQNGNSSKKKKKSSEVEMITIDKAPSWW